MSQRGPRKNFTPLSEPKRTTFTPGFDVSTPSTPYVVVQNDPCALLADKIKNHMIANDREYSEFVIDGVLHIDYQKYILKFAHELELAKLHPSQVELAKKYREWINKLSYGFSTNDNFVNAVNKAYLSCILGARPKM